ncbi:helix-turn-helix domain-containing protein [Ferrimonas pelagia]|uniref:HTH tetR-type domain-containing protein n=1 Tax=Ferrimonas pelagia TaxID=1177826 RepID=A0ABP9EYS7_9GAMM
MTRSRNELEGEIIKASHKVISERGLISFTFSEIAREAKVNISSLRLCFFTKEDLLARILIGHFDGQYARLGYILDELKHPKEQLLAHGFSLVYPDYLREDRSGSQFLLSNPAIWTALPPFRQEQLKSSFGRLAKRVRSIIDNAIENGLLIGKAKEHHQLFSSYARGSSLQLQNPLYLAEDKQQAQVVIQNNLCQLIERMPWQGTPVQIDLNRIKMIVRSASDQSNTSLI